MRLDKYILFFLLLTLIEYTIKKVCDKMIDKHIEKLRKSKE